MDDAADFFPEAAGRLPFFRYFNQGGFLCLNCFANCELLKAWIMFPDISA